MTQEHALINFLTAQYADENGKCYFACIKEVRTNTKMQPVIKDVIDTFYKLNYENARGVFMMGINEVIG